MNIEHIRRFIQIIENGGVRSAGETTQTSPMLYSNSLKALENEFGVKLLYTSSHGISLTSKGEEFLDYAQRILQLYDEAEKRVKTANYDLIKVATDPHYYRLIVETLPRDFYSRFSFIQIEYKNYISEIVKGNAEISFLYYLPKICRYKTLIYKQLYSDQIGIVVSKEHPFAKMKEIDISNIVHQMIYLNTNFCSFKIEKLANTLSKNNTIFKSDKLMKEHVSQKLFNNELIVLCHGSYIIKNYKQLRFIPIIDCDESFGILYKEEISNDIIEKISKEFNTVSIRL